ncbi:hypothetical protein [Pseudomonas sp. LB3P25]
MKRTLPTAVADDFLPKAQYSQAWVRCGAHYRLPYQQVHQHRVFEEAQ